MKNILKRILVLFIWAIAYCCLFITVPFTPITGIIAIIIYLINGKVNMELVIFPIDFVIQNAIKLTDKLETNEYNK